MSNETDSKIFKFKVNMTCEGCSGAVERVLGKLKDKGVEDVDINLGEKTVQVKSTLPADQILEVIKKTGKDVELISSS